MLYNKKLCSTFTPANKNINTNNQTNSIMKSAIYPSLALAAVLSFASCGYESPKYKALKAHTDSIAAVQQSLAEDDLLI